MYTREKYCAIAKFAPYCNPNCKWTESQNSNSMLYTQPGNNSLITHSHRTDVQIYTDVVQCTISYVMNNDPKRH